MPTAARDGIVVVGAGIVGVCCALWLQRSGHRVVLVDGNDPGTATSSGSACTIAVHGCVPVNHPALIRQLPKLLLASLLGGGPLSIDPRYAAGHLRWFAGFVNHCRAAEVEKITRALGQLLTHTYHGLQPLVAMAGCQHLFADRGCLYAYPTERAFAADQQNMRVRQAHGVECQMLNADEVRQLEPHLKIRFARGILFNQSKNVLNPGSLVEAFFQCFMQHGGEWHKQNATMVRETSDGLQVQLANGETLAAAKVVLAAGAFSRQIAGCGTASLPLGTERGYHVQFSDRQHLASRPICWVGRGFYATPTDQGLRFAGIVELAGLSSTKNQKILNYLARTAAQMFDLSKQPDQTWLGHRPTLPDSLPVIGASPRSKNILLAFGHQHLGLTLAGITGQLIAQLIDSQPTTLDIAPFSAARFL